MTAPTSGFQEHLARTPSSRTPGVDIDTRLHYTEGPPYLEKLQVLTPVSGRMILTPGSIGTVRIQDRTGHSHTFLHLHLDPSLPGAPFGFLPTRANESVDKGGIIGLLGNVGVLSGRDHVHYYIQDASGRYLDPQNLYVDATGAVIGIRDRGMHRENMLLQNSWESDDSVFYDDISPPDVTNIA